VRSSTDAPNWGSKAVTVAPELIAAYERAEFHVYGKKPTVLRVNRDESVAAWLDSLDAHLAFVLSASNPFRQQSFAVENLKRQERLISAVHDARLRWTAAQGTDPLGVLPPLDGVCVLDAPLALVDEWMRHFEQDVVIQASGSGNVTLRLHPAERAATLI
jgi:hypothetical protein